MNRPVCAAVFVTMVCCWFAGIPTARGNATVGVGARVYSPAEETASDLYGADIGTMISFDYAMTDAAGLRLGTTWIRQFGDAYPPDGTFLNSPQARQTLAPLELLFYGRIPSTSVRKRPPKTTFLIGGGFVYMLFREKLPEMPKATDGQVGFTFFFGPEFLLNDSFTLGLEMQWWDVEVFPESRTRSYRANLDGVSLQVILRYGL